MTEEQLKKYDFIVLVDKSGSMDTEDCGGKSRFDYAQESVLQIARTCEKYDSNGISVGMFNNSLKTYENITSGTNKLAELFKENHPGGGTDTAGAVKHYIDEYLASKAKDVANAKPIIVVIITDGCPNDEQALVDVIVNTTKKLQSREEVGLEFVQVGKDEHAKKFLDRLDNGLTAAGATLDIVNTVNCDDLGDLSVVEVLMKSLTE